MRNVEIIFQNPRVLPGEKLEGMITIVTDESFDCNRVVLKVRGKEHTEYSAGENRVSDDRVIVGKVFRISEGLTIPDGTTRFPFSFLLPKKLPPAYQGFHGYIEYSVEAVVEVDWAIDPKCKEEFRVLQNRPPYLEETTQLEPSTLAEDELQIQLEDNVLRLDTGLKVQFKVKKRNRVNGVRFEIIRREVAQCHNTTLDHDSTVQRKFYPIGLDDFDRWLEIDIGDGWRYHLPFLSGLFKVTYHLKVTLDVGWDFDPCLRHSLKFSDKAPEKDVLEEIAIDLGFKDW